MKYLFTIIQAQFIVTLACYGTFGQVQKIYYSGTNVTIEVSGSIYDNDNSPSLYDPLAGVLVWGVSNEQDGSATITQVLQGTHYYKSQPDVLNFTSNPGVNYIYVCAINDDQLSDPQGSYTVKVNGVDYTITIDNVIYLEDFYPSKVKKIHYSGTNVSIEVSNSIYDNDNSPSLYDPLAGVLVWGVSNEQDGSASVAQVLQGTHYYKNQPDVWNFISNPAVDYIYACAINDDPLSDPQGSYTIKVNGVDYTITIDNVIYLEDEFIVPGELVAYYPFNGNANDESGNGNDGIVNGAKLTNDRFENINSAYYFDGIDDEIILGSEPFNFINHSYAISVWAKWDIASNSGTHIFDKQGYPVNGGGGYRLYTGATGEIIFAISTEVFGSGFVEYNTHIIPNLDTWYHLVANVDVTGSTTVYINSEAKVMDLTEPLIGNAFELKLGRRIDFNGSRFKGIIDDVRIYNRELSQAEIDELYHEGGWPGGNGLVAYYPFNGNANDESGNGNHGTVTGANFTSDRFGNTSSACNFDGIDDEINFGDVSFYNGVAAASISVWVKYTEHSGTYDPFVTKGGMAEHETFGLGTTNEGSGVMRIEFGGDGPVISVATTNDKADNGEWHHIVTLLENTVPKIYIDGILSSIVAASNVTQIKNQANDMMMGSNLRSDGKYWYNGVLDDVRIYDYALTEAEILALYHEDGWPGGGEDLVAYYPFNGNANDESGNGYDGIVSGAWLRTHSD